MDKKRSIKFIIGVLVILIVILFIIGAIEFIFSKATSWCPLSHRLNMDMHCIVRDTIDDSVLVEHFNIDTNILQLSIHSKSGITWIKHPYGIAKSYVDQVAHNKIKFDKINSQKIIVNDKDTLNIEVIAVE